MRGYEGRGGAGGGCQGAVEDVQVHSEHDREGTQAGKKARRDRGEDGSRAAGSARIVVDYAACGDPLTCVPPLPAFCLT